MITKLLTKKKCSFPLSDVLSFSLRLSHECRMFMTKSSLRTPNSGAMRSGGERGHRERAIHTDHPVAQESK